MKNIYVGNLSFQTTEQDLEAAFAAYGHVENVNIIRDRDTGQSRGFAFVEMSGDADAEGAIRGLNGTELDGRSLKVVEARPREERTGGGRGGPGGGGGAGRGRGPSSHGPSRRREPRW
ncbi:MAG: RNA-binding protein [Bryobacteraceae bacterium]|nr:RNA-binding protein [Bryobacteraceae bacterium]